ncbi:MAG: PAS domain S-box protein, partial [Burkholderiales bacterium]
MLWELPFDAAPQIMSAHQMLVGVRRPFRDFLLKRKMDNGKTRYFLTSGDPVFNWDGAFAGYRGVGREITTEKWAEEALRESEQRYASIFHNSSAAIIVMSVAEDGLFRFESCNQAGESLLATRAYNLIGETPETALSDRIAQPMLARLSAALTSNSRVTEEHDLALAADTRRVVTTAVPIRRSIATGVQRVLLISIDITEQTRAAERASESEELFRRVFNGSPHAMSFVRASDGTITGVNKAWERLFGLSREAVIGHSSEAIGSLTPNARARELLDHLRAGGSVRDEDLTVNTREGLSAHLLYSAYTLQIGGELHIVSGFVDITERKEAEEALKRSEESFAKIFHLSPVPMVIHSYPVRGYVDVNDAWANLFGFAREEVIGKTPLDLGIWADAVSLTDVWSEFSRARRISNAERRMRKKSGEIVDTLNSAELVTIAGDDRVIVSSIDITERKAAERQLRQSERRFRDFAEAAGEFVWELDADRRITFVSNRVEQVLGYKQEELLGRRLPEFMPPGEAERINEMQAAKPATDGAFRNLEARATTRSGTTVWLTMSAVATLDGEGRSIGLRGTALDITARKLAEQRIEDLATRDSLTGLPNRHLLQDRLQQGIANAERGGATLAVMFIDLDHFKRINDTLGHHIGDVLLKEVARRLATVIRKGDTLARLGGDEFLIVLEGLKAPADAGQVAQKIIQALAAPYEVESHRLGTTASVGIALYPHDGADVATLMRHADIAMYAAKSGGRCTYQFFAAEMNQRVTARVELEHDLHQALAAGEMRIFFQPR